MKLRKEQDVTQSYVNQRRLILNANSSFHIQEAYRTLQTNIRFSLPGNGCKVICLTSSMASEGKSTTCLNLAISMADTGNRVLLIDADMRRPSLGKLLIEKTSPGLSNVLAGLCDVLTAVRKNIRPNLDVLFSGEIPPNPLELLSSKTMEKMLEQLKPLYDYIIVDTPPVTIVSDTCVIASLTDGTLMLVRQHEAEKDGVSKAVKQLQLANAKLLGFVLNGVTDDKGKAYKRKYKYGYKYKYTYEATNRGKA